MNIKSILIILGILLIPVLILMAGCGGVTMAQKGDTVKVHYTGTLSDGTQFDSSIGKTPLEFTIGSGQVIAGFDDAVTGMKVGEKKTVTIPADEAYGPRDESLVREISRDQLPDNITPVVGMQLMTSNGMPVVITAVNESNVTIDFNHPMAGKDLTFELELVEITR